MITKLGKTLWIYQQTFIKQLTVCYFCFLELLRLNTMPKLCLVDFLLFFSSNLYCRSKEMHELYFFTYIKYN